MLSYNIYKIYSYCLCFLCILELYLSNGGTIISVFVTIGLICNFFNCKDKLKKAELVMDDACKSLLVRNIKTKKVILLMKYINSTA